MSDIAVNGTVVDNGRGREAVYSSPHGPMVLSKGEKLVCEVWVKTRSIEACRRAMLGAYKRKVSRGCIERWMRYREAVRGYILELEGWEGGRMSEVEWEGRVGGIAKGDVAVNRGTPAMYKLYAEKKGWLKGNGEGGTNFSGRNIQVNILQSDGRE